ncbi:MAG: formylglycine-generating enzyme family protein [Bacteroidia bacterium]
MKKSILLLPILIVLISSTKKETIPPGTVKLSETTFIDNTEISNFSWLEYVYWTKNNNPDNLLNVLPDTTVWDSEPYKIHYFRHIAYRDYPVVGVSYEQAVEYCKWRSERVNESLYRKSRGLKITDKVSSEEIPQVFEYRLPTEEEFISVASVGNSEKIEKKINKTGMCITINAINPAIKSERQDVTAPVKSYWPNKLGIYNIFGNVAEMTSIKGLSKGGSWKDKVDEISAEKRHYCQKPENWLGFRCVCVRIN